jgi:hypothetical protein
MLSPDKLSQHKEQFACEEFFAIVPTLNQL